MAWAGAFVDFKDGVTWTGAANSDTTPTFVLLGGRYALGTYSTGTASAQLQVAVMDSQSPQVQQFVNCGAATTATDLFDLAPGTYRIVMGAAAGTAAGWLQRVPFRAA